MAMIIEQISTRARIEECGRGLYCAMSRSHAILFVLVLMGSGDRLPGLELTKGVALTMARSTEA
jgi:hypothetical protein